MKVLFIGDVHIKHTNLIGLQVLLDTLELFDEPVDCVVLAGDILDTHERVNVQLLNRAYDLVKLCREKATTFVLVGNHDYINNQQFLSDCHWMNGMKEWDRVVVVDKPTRWNDAIFVPYVFPGRFIEALNSCPNIDWLHAGVIFAHQEFKGCKMGAFTSTQGDEWDLTYPKVISGHIHERQNPQENIFYPGSVLTHAFGTENAAQAFSVFSFEPYSERVVTLNLPDKRTVYLKIGSGALKSKDLRDSTRFSVSGTVAEIAAFKKSKQYAAIISANAKISFRVDKQTEEKTRKPFMAVLHELVCDRKDERLFQDYMSVKTDID